MGETVHGSLVPEWADLDPSVMSEPVKAINVSYIASVIASVIVGLVR